MAHYQRSPSGLPVQVLHSRPVRQDAMVTPLLRAQRVSLVVQRRSPRTPRRGRFDHRPGGVFHPLSKGFQKEYGIAAYAGAMESDTFCAPPGMVEHCGEFARHSTRGVPSVGLAQGAQPRFGGTECGARNHGRAVRDPVGTAGDRVHGHISSRRQGPVPPSLR